MAIEVHRQQRPTVSKVRRDRYFKIDRSEDALSEAGGIARIETVSKYSFILLYKLQHITILKRGRLFFENCVALRK